MDGASVCWVGRGALELSIGLELSPANGASERVPWPNPLLDDGA